jgi:hypothetical protein
VSQWLEDGGWLSGFSICGFVLIGYTFVVTFTLAGVWQSTINRSSMTPSTSAEDRQSPSFTINFVNGKPDDHQPYIPSLKRYGIIETPHFALLGF